MAPDDRPTALVLTDGRFRSADAKTAHGLVRGPSRYRLLGVVDGAESAGDDAGRLLDGTPRGIPLYADLVTALADRGGPPDWCVVGVATSGGVLSPSLRGALLAAVRHGLSLVNGLHDLVGDDLELAAEARRTGARLVDLRRPKPFRELAFWSGAIRGVRAPRVAVLGTDCALGKRTTCQLLAAALAAADGSSTSPLRTTKLDAPPTSRSPAATPLSTSTPSRPLDSSAVTCEDALNEARRSLDEGTLDDEPAFGEHVAALARLRKKCADRTVYSRFVHTRGLEIEGADGSGGWRWRMQPKKG